MVFVLDLEKAGKAESSDSRRHRNAKPHNRAARNDYMKTSAGKAANLKAQANYRSSHPERYSAQQKARTDGSGGHKCVRCGKPAVHKHHVSYKDHNNYEWLCHAHHVKAHHPKSNLTKASEDGMAKANFVLPAMSSEPETNYHVRLDVLDWVQRLSPNSASGLSQEGQRGLTFLKSFCGDTWYEQFEGTTYYTEALRVAAEHSRELRKGGADQQYLETKETLIIDFLKKGVVMPEAGQIVSMDVNDEHGDRCRILDTVKLGSAITAAIMTFLSEDDVGAWQTVPMGPRLRLHLHEMMDSKDADGKGMGQESKDPKMSAEGNSMNKSELFEAIRGNDVDDFVKSMNSVDHSALPGSEHAETGQDASIASGAPGASGDGKLDSEPKVGMPAANGGSEQVWSDDDKSVSAQMGPGAGSMETAAHGGAGGGGGGVEQTANQKKDPTMKKSQISRGGCYQYSTSEDDFIAKSMDSNGCVETEPSLGFPNSPLVSVHTCVNDMCKSAYSQVLTTCPSCGIDRLDGGSAQLSKGYRGVIIDQGVANSLRPPAQDILRLPAGFTVD